MKQLPLMILCIAVLTACGSGRGAAQRYTLSPDDGFHAPSCRTGGAIKIVEPTPAPGLEGFRIVVIDRPNHQTHYRGVAWNATAPHLVQGYLTEAFERSGMFSHVGTDTDGIRTPWLLETRLRGLHVDQSSGRPEIVIRLTATLTDAASRRPVASMPFERRSDASGLSIEAIIARFNQQMADITTELLERLRKPLHCR